MKNRKGFTLIELLAVIVILSILITLATFNYSIYLKRSKENSMKLAVNSFEDAVASALQDCETGSENAFCTKFTGIPAPGEDNSITVDLDDVVKSHYIEKIKSPYNSSEFCTGTTKVERIDVDKIKHSKKNSDGTTTSEYWEGDDSNIELKYTTCLVCSNHSSEGC